MNSRRNFLNSLSRLASGLFVPSAFAILHQLETELEAQVGPALPYYGGGGAGSTCNFSVNAATTTWLTHTTATPDSTTQNAANCFWNAMQAAGLDTSIVGLNFFPHDSVDGSSLGDIARYAYISGGVNPWSVNSFGQGDLTVNGLKGDGSSKYVDTGITGSQFPSDTSAGLTFYVYTPSTSTTSQTCGYTNDTGSDTAALLDNFSGNAVGNIFGPAGTSLSTTSPGAGYYSLNRTANNVMKLYFANSTMPHGQIGSTLTNTAGTRGAHNIRIWSRNHWNSANPSDLGFSDARLSFFAIHAGLTLAQSATFFSLVQQLRQNLGGGFV